MIACLLQSVEVCYGKPWASRNPVTGGQVVALGQNLQIHARRPCEVLQTMADEACFGANFPNFANFTPDHLCNPRLAAEPTPPPLPHARIKVAIPNQAATAP
jgi:hypothetical protein